VADPFTNTQAATGLTGALLLLLGPKFGPLLAPVIGDYLLIFGGAVAGVMHPVSTQGFVTRTAAVWYMLRWVFTAAALTAAAAAGIEKYLGLPASNWPGAVAFGITFLADRWRGLVDMGMGWIRARAGGGSEPGQGGAP
jgi:hypothetical protein